MHHQSPQARRPKEDQAGSQGAPQPDGGSQHRRPAGRRAGPLCAVSQSRDGVRGERRLEGAISRTERARHQVLYVSVAQGALEIPRVIGEARQLKSLLIVRYRRWTSCIREGLCTEM